MGRTRTRVAGVLVVGLVAAGLAGIVTSGPAGAAGCTITLTDQTSYTGTDAAETVCIDGTGDYTVDTAGGSDTVRVLDTAASVDATLGDGEDTYVGTKAATSTVDAGTGDDRITTGVGADTVNGGAGNDIIVTKDGDDTVTGGDGIDRIVTGNGDDTIEAGSGDDKVVSQDGDDNIKGQDGSDNINGGNGDDTINGGPDADKIAGSVGADDLSGGTGADKIVGGPGDDTLDGGPGTDIVAGNTGVDALSGGADADVMSGGTEDDAFDGTALDAAAAGTGDAACSDGSELALACVSGAAVVSVDHQVAATPTGWRVTVQTHALDFAGVGVSRIALAEREWTTPNYNSESVGGDPSWGDYYSAVPALVSGTMVNGVFEASFHIDKAPVSGQFGVRVFTNGFSVEAWTACDRGLCLPYAPNSWPCISSYIFGDAECGFYSGVGAVMAGFPKAMRSIQVDVAPASDATITTTEWPGGLSAQLQAGANSAIYGYGVVWTPQQTSFVDRVVDQNYGRVPYLCNPSCSNLALHPDLMRSMAPDYSSITDSASMSTSAPTCEVAQGQYGRGGEFVYVARPWVIATTPGGGLSWYLSSSGTTSKFRC